MKIGVAVPNIGPVATPEAVKTVAQKAEALGYHSLCTVERVLWPVAPKLPYPATPDGSLPEEYKYNLDPLDTLDLRGCLHQQNQAGNQRAGYPLLQSSFAGAAAEHDRCFVEGTAAGRLWRGLVAGRDGSGGS